MYEEIAAYDGDFGDPIAEYVDFEPLLVLLGDEADQFVRCGASIALLVNYVVALDNCGPHAALHSREYRDLDAALNRGLLAEFPAIEAAARLARDGDAPFFVSLQAVYVNYIEPHFA